METYRRYLGIFYLTLVLAYVAGLIAGIVFPEVFYLFLKNAADKVNPTAEGLFAHNITVIMVYLLFLTAIPSLIVLFKKRGYTILKYIVLAPVIANGFLMGGVTSSREVITHLNNFCYPQGSLVIGLGLCVHGVPELTSVILFLSLPYALASGLLNIRRGMVVAVVALALLMIAALLEAHVTPLIIDYLLKVFCG